MVSNKIISCPFCGRDYPFTKEFKYENGISYNIGNANRFFFDINRIMSDNLFYSPKAYEITITRCPYCHEDRLTVNSGQITIKGKQNGLYNFNEKTDSCLNMQIRPKSVHKCFPDYVPKAICEDYEEACSILALSPKAAATLARRALEGMILDYWEIPAKSKGNLKKEIAELEGKIPIDQWKAIDALRNLGNIGAHMENDTSVIIDIDPGEAEKLLILIEHLVDQWYIAKHNQKQLYDDIVGINNEKEQERKNASKAPAQN